MLTDAVHADEKQGPQVVLTEGAILGGGAFSRVSIVAGRCLSSFAVSSDDRLMASPVLGSGQISYHSQHLLAW